ncbi:MAG TPA: histidine phosphatase family protein [Anaerolineales bacterium]|nr:histidine phosphatase family protein [Anaerolineales bacterium]
MPVLLLIRHGENEYVKNGRLAGRMPGVHLNEKGKSQAQAIAERLKPAPLKAIYSSPLERALETAEPLAVAKGLAIIPRQGLLETDFGEWQGKTLKSLRRRKLWRLVQGSPSMLRFPGGETFAECQLRIAQELQAIATLHKPKEMVACVFHSDPIKLAVAYYLGMPLDNFQRLMIAPASITGLFLGETGARLLNLNFDLSLNLSNS